jgi:hypothetical protein
MEGKVKCKSVSYNYQINSKYKDIEDFVLSIPEIFENEGEQICTGRNTIKIFKYKGLLINVKSFKIPHFINKVAYKYIRFSKAKKSFYLGTEIIKRGANTPEPIAYLNGSKSALFNKSYYVSIHQSYDFTVRELIGFEFENKEEILRQLTRFTYYALHKNSIHHLDYSRGNVLITDRGNNKYDFSIVDINRLRFEKFDYIKGLKNFAQFWAEEEEIRVFADEYAKLNNQDTNQAFKYLNEFNLNHKKKINTKTKFKDKLKGK